MKAKLKITYLVNSGLLLQAGRTKIMIDGLIEDNTIFDHLPLEVKEAQLAGTGMFQNIDALVFTHCHGDHFSAQEISKYLKKHPCVKLLLPQTDETRRFESRSQTIIMKTVLFESREVSIGAFEIEFFKTGHVSEAVVGGREHYAFLIRGGGRCTAITADFDLEKIEELKKKCEAADTIFFNPLVLGTPKTRAALRTFHTKQLFIYHIPIETEDPYSYRKMAEYNYKRYGRELPGCRLILKHYLEVP